MKRDAGVDGKRIPGPIIKEGVRAPKSVGTLRRQKSLFLPEININS
jgi:hypothetical protein